MFIFKKIILLITGILFSQNLLAQIGKYDTIRVSGIVIDKDTLPHQWIQEVYVTEKAPKWLVKKRKQMRERDEELSRLRANVYAVYPYAVAASYILQDVDSVLNSLASKDAKKIYKQRKEAQLKKEFKGVLEDMTIDQGQVLIKLIARQTGKPCYQIVRELKGGFNAGLWQTVAIIFSHNLKNTYDAQGEDADIEAIVLEIESRQRR